MAAKSPKQHRVTNVALQKKIIVQKLREYFGTEKQNLCHIAPNKDDIRFCPLSLARCFVGFVVVAPEPTGEHKPLLGDHCWFQSPEMVLAFLAHVCEIPLEETIDGETLTGTPANNLLAWHLEQFRESDPKIKIPTIEQYLRMTATSPFGGKLPGGVQNWRKYLDEDTLNSLLDWDSPCLIYRIKERRELEAAADITAALDAKKAEKKTLAEKRKAEKIAKASSEQLPLVAPNSPPKTPEAKEKKKRAPRKRKASDAEEEAAEVSPDPKPKKPRKPRAPRKKKQKTTDEAEAEAEEDVVMNEGGVPFVPPTTPDLHDDEDDDSAMSELLRIRG